RRVILLTGGRVMNYGPRAALALAAAWLFLLGVGAAEESDKRPDVHSFSRPDQVRVTKVELALNVDFAAKALHGSATLHVERQPGCPAGAPLILDTKGLVIEGVVIPEGPIQGRPVPFRLEKEKDDPILGTPLSVALPPDEKQVKITYRTTEKSTALQ